MTPFQWIAVPILGFAAVLELVKLFRIPGQHGYRLFRAALWGSAAATIYYPDFFSHTARFVGIASGAHLVLYLFVLAFPVVSLLLYARVQQLQRQITDLVRVLAIQQARSGE